MASGVIKLTNNMLIQSGTKAMTKTSGTLSWRASVTFDKPYSSNPTVVFSIAAESGYTNPLVTGLSTTSCGFFIDNASGTSYTVHWIAIGT